MAELMDHNMADLLCPQCRAVLLVKVVMQRPGPKIGPLVERATEADKRGTPPHCGRCGLEYRLDGTGPAPFNPAVTLDYYRPRCDCWKRSYRE